MSVELRILRIIVLKNMGSAYFIHVRTSYCGRTPWTALRVVLPNKYQPAITEAR